MLPFCDPHLRNGDNCEITGCQVGGPQRMTQPAVHSAREKPDRLLKQWPMFSKHVQLLLLCIVKNMSSKQI